MTMHMHGCVQIEDATRLRPGLSPRNPASKSMLPSRCPAEKLAKPVPLQRAEPSSPRADYVPGSCVWGFQVNLPGMNERKVRSTRYKLAGAQSIEDRNSNIRPASFPPERPQGPNPKGWLQAGLQAGADVDDLVERIHDAGTPRGAFAPTHLIKAAECASAVAFLCL